MSKYNILFIDDDPLILATNKPLLEKKNYNVSIASSGTEALQLIEKNHYDLVITDLVMQDVYGISILQKAKSKNNETMVIILTGYGDLKSAIEALRLDADDYLLKPCEIEEFLFRINRSFEKLELIRRVKMYEKLLPVCTYCKKIRDDTNSEYGHGDWISMEEFIHSRTKIDISHSICPHCAQRIEKNLGDI